MRWPTTIIAATVALAIAPAFTVECPKGDALTGTYSPVDGDSGYLGETEIRLQGLAAPEMNEPGGQEASDAMTAMVLGKAVTCELDGTSTYDRCVAICRVDGADISEELVRCWAGARLSAFQRRALSRCRAGSGRSRRDDQGDL